MHVIDKRIVPDLIVLQSNEDWDATGELNEWRRQLYCDGVEIPTKSVGDLTIDDVRDKIVCGEMPLRLAQYAALVIVCTPVSESEFDSVEASGFDLSDRIIALKTHRAAKQPAC